MAQGKIACRICGDVHRLTTKHFPLVLMLPPKDKKGNLIQGEPILSGYACRKCDRKNRRAKFIEHYGIKSKPGEKLAVAIQEKEKELALGRKG